MNQGSRGRYVQVALNRPLWQTFTYYLPPRYCGGRLEGCRVAVPFGKDRLVGYITAAGGTVEPAGIKVREVLERLDTSPLLSGKLAELVRWSAEYYMAPVGMMFAAAHPPGLTGKVERVVVLRGEMDGSHPLSRYLHPSGAVRLSVLRDSLTGGYPLESELGNLEEEGLVQVFWRPVSAPRPVMERMIQVVEGCGSLIRTAEALKKRAPRQAEILAHMAASEGPLPRGEILRSTGASPSSLDALLHRGLLREFLRRKTREPRMGGGIEKEKAIPSLTGPQQGALDRINSGLGSHGVFLVHGVTGSGKTEIYLRVISEVLASGGTALVLVPEISLTPLTVSRFSSRFPGKVAVLHSGMSHGERLDSWNLLKTGERRIAIGPRSAVFAPLPDLGVIVVDEEHDGSYKQSELPRYNGRDVAVMRGSMENIPVVLGSASPSMESYGNAMEGKYQLLELKERIDGNPLPSTVMVGQGVSEGSLLSRELLAGIDERMQRGEQCIVLINRRGFSPTQMCRNCGHREECPNCGVALTFHKKGHVLRCHHCSFWKAAMVRCPRCGFDEFAHMGPGIQKVEESLSSALPGCRIIRMDSDTTVSKDAHWDILGRFAGGGGDVLLGTQMVAKGHDFPGVTLVGIISADMGLAFPDFRAAERTFQLVLQVSGRAGRGSLPGEVVLQVYDMKSDTIRAAADQDFHQFWEMESGVRKAFGYPPYGYLVRFLWSGLGRDSVQKVSRRCVEGLDTGGVNLSDPCEAAFPRINRRWRWSSLARSGSRKALASLARRMRDRFQSMPGRGVRLDIDIDPHNLL